MVENDNMQIPCYCHVYRNRKMNRKLKFTKQKVPLNKQCEEMTKFLSKRTNA